MLIKSLMCAMMLACLGCTSAHSHGFTQTTSGVLSIDVIQSMPSKPTVLFIIVAKRKLMTL